MLSTVHRTAMNLKEHSLDFEPIPSQQPELSNIARVATRAFQILKKSKFETPIFAGEGFHLGNWEIAKN